MQGLVEGTRRSVNKTCIVRTIKKEGCEIVLKDAPPSRLIIDFDKPGSPLRAPQLRCDYLFIAERGDDGWVAPVELKKGKFHAGQFVRQIKAGSRVAERLVPQGIKVKFRPIAAYGGGIHRAELDELKRKSNMIRFQGKHEVVRLIRCGDELTKGFYA